MSKTKDKPNINGVTPKPKEKRRSNEKRKEKSRDAARCRRSRETEIFTELGQVLPLQREEVEQLDKASIMRLSIAYLKVREMLNLFPDVDNEPPPLLSGDDDKVEESERKPFDLLNGPESYKYLSAALDGFLMILSGEGDVTYVSENISEYLGISQIDLLGQQIWEYTHQCDHEELKEALNMRRFDLVDDKPKENGCTGSAEDNAANERITTAHRDVFLRLKCTLTSRGRSVNIKSASYKVIHLTGHMVMNATGDRILIGIGRPLPHPSNIEIPLGSATFLTKHSLDMKFTYVDDKMLSLLGYEPEDLLGTSLYDCHHGADSESLMTTFKSVLSKGQGETCRYRFLGKLGGYCWVVTQATIVYDKQKPQSVVCVNYAVSELENDNEIYSCGQLEAYRQNKEIPDKEEQQENFECQQHHHHQSQPKFNSLQNAANIKNDSCAVGVRLSAVKTLLKQQVAANNVDEGHQIAVKSHDTPIGFNLDETLQQQPKVRNNNADIIIRKGSDNISLSPVRRTLNHCSISPLNAKVPPKSSIAPGKRPKSVTASVFTQVPINTELNTTLNLTQSNCLPVTSIVGNHQQQLQSQQPPSVPAKSVTASVLMPISALTSPITRSFLPNSLCKNLSRNSNYNSVDNNNSSNCNNSNQNITTQDMNSRYLMFSDETPELTMLKEEPDDLTHLAPSLDDSTHLFGEMLDSLILPDAYGTLLSDDINSLDSQQSKCNNSKSGNHIDPFINYRDESSDTSSSPHLLSPGSVSKSPEMSSIPSLCSPNSLSQDDEFAFMTMNVEDDIDLTMRAPYIPMNEQEDLPLLTEDLMWSAFSEELSLHKEALQMEALKNGHNSALNNNSNNNNNVNSSSNCMTAIPTITSVDRNCNNNSHNSNNKTNMSTAQDNRNITGGESSLATLLCSNGGVDSLQQQPHHSPLRNSDGSNTTSDVANSSSGNDCKRRKMSDRSDNFAGNMIDSIDDFGAVFSKNSSNVDCWSMTELLQMNDPSPISSETTSLHHQQPDGVSEKQNIIINTAIPTTTIHVPLIALSNKNSNSKITCSSLFNVNGATTNSKLNNCNTNLNTNNNSNPMRRMSTQLVKGVNINITQTAINNTSISSGKAPITTLNLGAIVNTQNNSGKRPSNIILTSSETKRLKNTPVSETPTAPQLLQQLMAPSPQRAGSKAAYDKMQNSGNGWTSNFDGSMATGKNSGTSRNNSGSQPANSVAVQSQSSNSVLKNLLVSGCDDTFANQPPDIIVEDELSRSLQGSPQPSYFGSPLMCKVSTEHVLRRRGANPLIGGEGILPSPPIPIDDDADEGGGGISSKINMSSLDSLVGGAFSPVESDSGGSDSGIECGAPSNRGSSLMQSVFKVGQITEKEGNLKLKSSSKVEPPVTSPDLKITSINRLSEADGSRKMSFSFLDEETPLCSPFLMDFCNDIYPMDEPMDSEILQGNDLTRALNEWPITNSRT